MIASIKSSRADLGNFSSAQQAVLNFIDSTFKQILTEIKKRPYGQPKIELERINACRTTQDKDSSELVSEVQSCQITYGWPGKSVDEAWRFACIGRLLFEIQRAIRSGVTITKRDIYYHDPELFQRQDMVDRYIDDIAYTCKVTRKDLNVTASPRGLYAIPDHRNWDVNIATEEAVFHTNSSIEEIRWILVIEKEATFKFLHEKKTHKAIATGPGMLVTARGYPDLMTRKFLHSTIERIKSSIPVYGLFDADPDGVNIFMCYLAGSKVTVNEAEIAIPQLRWLGIDFEDVDAEDCMLLTARDRKRAQAMLGRTKEYPTLSQVYICREMLQHMLMLNIKAEIQACEGGSEGLVEMLAFRIANFSSVIP